MRLIATLILACLALHGFATDATIGLGPVPTNSTLLAPGPIGSTTPSSGAFTTLSATGQITSTLATGTAPLVIASTTVVANLNASSLGGATFAAPGPIGSGTPAAATHTTIAATDTTAASITTPGGVTSTVATGTAPITVSSTTVCPNLNAAALGGATFAAPGSIGSGTPAAGAFTTLTANGAVTATGTTDASSSTVGGTLTDSGGLAVAKRSFFGDKVTIAAANAANSLSVAGASGQYATFVQANSTTGSSFGMQVLGGTNSSDQCLSLANQSGGTTFLTVLGTGNATAAGIWTFSGTTDSTSSTSGEIKDSGGLGVAKNIVGAQGLGIGVTSVTTAAGTTAMSTSSTACQVFTGTTTQTLTLPAANAFGAGIAYVVYVKNVSTGTVTVQRAGSDTINSTASNVTSFTLAQWATATLFSDGVSAWERF